MRIGLIARADNSGLGVQTWEFWRHMHPAKTMVIDVSEEHNTTSHCNKATYLHRYPGASVVKGWRPSRAEIEQFLDGLDVVFTCETPYNPLVFALAAERGIRTVLQFNYELLDNISNKFAEVPSVFAAPTRWHYDDVPFRNKVHLPVPVALDRLNPSGLEGLRVAREFLHIVGRPAVHDRNGTDDFIRALRYVKSDIAVTIKTQDKAFMPDLSGVPAHVAVSIDHTDVQNYWDNYQWGHVLVMPRRYGGLCLPAQEAIAAGMPVIMPAISPNEWLPADWLIPAKHAGKFRAKAMIDYYSVDHRALAAKIDEMANDQGFIRKAQIVGHDLAHAHSWDTLTPLYHEVLDGR